MSDYRDVFDAGHDEGLKKGIRLGLEAAAQVLECQAAEERRDMWRGREYSALMFAIDAVRDLSPEQIAAQREGGDG